MRCLIPHVSRRTARLAVVTALLFLPCATAVSDDVPDGLPVGKWIVAPSFSVNYEADDNVFFEDDDNASSDQVTTFEGEIEAILPFRNSSLEFDYTAAKESYSNNEFSRDVTHEFGFELELNFNSGDRLTLSDDYRRDLARASDDNVDPGGEQSFQGEPYNYNRWEVELSRRDPDRQGYLVRIRRQDFIYDGEQDIGFLEYRGFDNWFEYRQPLPGNRSWVMTYHSRRFNLYDPFDDVGVVFRKEETDSGLFGVRGFLGEGQPYRVLIGFGRFRFTGDDPDEFSDLVLSAAWRMWLGGRTNLDLEAVRRTLPSSFDTYYINNVVAATFEREWLRFESGVRLEVSRNDYAGNAIGSDCSGAREDSRYKTEVDVGWRAHERLRFELSSFYTVRSSNCDSAEYQAAGIETGISFGWF